MIVRELPTRDSLVLAGIRRFRRAEAARTGLHCSTIVNDFLLCADPSRAKYDDLDPDTSLLFQEIGNALEDIVAASLLARVLSWTKPEPRAYRKIIGSPDGWSPRSRCIDEIKVHWASERDFLTLDAGGHPIEESLKFSGYIMQILFYMKLFDAVRARLHVLFVAGNYRPPFPKPRTFLLKPTPAEIDANFDKLYQHAVDRGLFRLAA